MIDRGLVIALPRVYKQLVGVAADAFSLFLAVNLAYLLRLESLSVPSSTIDFFIAFLLPIAIALSVFWGLGLYKSLVRFMSARGLVIISIGACIAASSHYLLATALDLMVPRSVPVIFMLLAMTAVAGSRGVFRIWFTSGRKHEREKVIVFGAGQSGVDLIAALQHGNQFFPIALVDDDRNKQNTIIHGLHVYSPAELNQLIDEYAVTRVFLAIEGLSKAQRATILRFLEPMAVRVQTVPSMAEVISGHARIMDIRDLEIEDLLGRDPVHPDSSLLRSCIADKIVLVTGAGGSIGSELCRQILLQNPKKLVLLDSSEFGLYQIEQDLRKLLEQYDLSVPVMALLGSVQKEHRMEVIMRTFGVQTVYHAAAYKHVPMVEHNVVEGVRNNVFGTWYTAEAAIRSGVETFVLISTDKAVRPTNVMGASKRMAELVLQGLAARQKKTRFCMVRFGNVLGSSGSVVPLFQEQILKGGPVTVTHPDIIRFFMTIPEAAQLVIQAGSMGQGGEVFLLDMGDPVRIADLARKMVHLMGHSVKGKDGEGDIEIVYTGLRPGEKLYEELLIGENPAGTDHARIMKAREASLPWEEVESLMKELDKACHTFDCERVREILLSAPTGYQPTGANEDLVWQRHLKDTQGMGIIRNLGAVAVKQG
jgi:FlaA1/EpsC-like NDP-sugar epimerase